MVQLSPHSTIYSTFQSKNEIPTKMKTSYFSNKDENFSNMHIDYQQQKHKSSTITLKGANFRQKTGRKLPT